MKEKDISVASLFCGAGGLDMGFTNGGCTTIWANDFNRDACATFASWNKDAEVVCGDVGGVMPESVPDVDVMLGGFPCQGFSVAGPRNVDDPRNKLYHHYVRLVSAKKPAAFVGENVKGLVKMEHGQVFECIRHDFAECGYDVFAELVNAKNFGVPEDRERIILMGFRKDLGVTNVGEFERSGFVTMRDAIGEMDEPDTDEVCDQAFSPRYMSRNRKRGWDSVSFTIPAMAKQVPIWPGSPDMVKLGPDEWKFGDGDTRRLSYRECAAIQTFPTEIEFKGNLVSKYRQIGNAVPPKLAHTVAKRVRDVLEKVHYL